MCRTLRVRSWILPATLVDPPTWVFEHAFNVGNCLTFRSLIRTDNYLGKTLRVEAVATDPLLPSECASASRGLAPSIGNQCANTISNRKPDQQANSKSNFCKGYHCAVTVTEVRPTATTREFPCRNSRPSPLAPLCCTEALNPASHPGGVLLLHGAALPWASASRPHSVRLRA